MPFINNKIYKNCLKIAFFFSICGWITFLLSGTAINKPKPIKRVTIQAITGIQYDIVRFKVEPREKIKLVFKNTAALVHNLLITKPGTRVKVVEAALNLGGRATSMEWNPGTSDVLWATPLLSPGESASIIFTAPEKEGVYPYECTYSGHGYTMYGAMYVTNSDDLPPRGHDENIPESKRESSGKGQNDQKVKKTHQLHPPAPYFLRTFMPDASPAPIAVRLTDNLSYCWDTDSCQLLYVWKGDFLDNSVFWKGHQNSEAEILGEIFYKLKDENPFRLNGQKSPPKVNYMGFKLTEERYPEFHYMLNNIDVYEKIEPNTNGRGLIQTIRIPDYNGIVRMKLDAEGKYIRSSTKGNWNDSILKIKPEDVQKFSISIKEEK